MTDNNGTDFGDLIAATVDIQYLIVKAGGMANKSLVEDNLMRMFGVEHCDAHEATNTVEYENIRAFRIDGETATWTAMRPEPTLDQYPDLNVGKIYRKGVE